MSFAVGRPLNTAPLKRPFASDRAVARHRCSTISVKAEITLDDKLQDTPGVGNLLQRDFKEVELNEDAFADPASLEAEVAEEAVAPVEPPRSSAPPTPEVAEGRRRREELRADTDAPRRSREAIDRGTALIQQGKHQDAIDMFQLALELPGSGVMRMSGSPKEYACASEGEENAALYNMACAYCLMTPPQPSAALTCLEAALDNGFEDFGAIRADPDLRLLGGAELDKLLSKYDGLFAKVFRKRKLGDAGEKPWLLW